jgi:phage/plasmid-like protein (TIGR03299 family)
MAHELDHTTVNGEERKAMFSVRETPWHREGTILSEVPTLDEALALGGLDFEVEKREIYLRAIEHSYEYPGDGSRIEHEQETFVKQDGHFATVRTDREQILGTVQQRYSVLQNREAFGVLEPLLDDGIVTLETGGSLRGGVDVWMLVKFSAEGIARAASQADNVEAFRLSHLEGMFDEVQPYGLITNNHAGLRGVILKETPVRVVCANTLTMALAKADRGTTIKVVHSGDVQKNVELAADALFRTSRRYVDFAGQRELLRRTEISFERDFNRLVLDPVVPVRHLERKIARDDGNARTEAHLKRAVEKRDRIRELWTQGEGHRGDRSAWEAFNGLTQALDHDEMFAPRTDRVQAMIHNGHLEAKKGEVLNRLVGFAARKGDSADQEFARYLGVKV